MDASSDSPNSETAARLTPMMAQYLEIKAVNPGCLLFYRMGDFYELFFGAAEIASRVLGIVLTKRGKPEGEAIRMCGVPVERADDYLNRLIALGHRVAVCEQMEDPAAAKKRGPKSVVRRDVVRLVTPGTITEERLLEPGRARLLAAVQKVRSSEGRQGYGPAALAPATRANLELTRTLSGARDGSLLATIDLTVTPAGARLLAERLASPLTDPEAVNRRLDSLEFLVEAAPMRDALRRALMHAPDFLRALARLSLDRGGPRDLAAVRDGLAAAVTLASILEAAPELPPQLLPPHAR